MSIIRIVKNIVHNICYNIGEITMKLKKHDGEI